MSLNRMKQTGACLCLALAFISSCKSPMYVPPSVNLPMMDSAGQVEGRLGYRNANLNVSVGKKLVVTAQVQWLDKRGNSWGTSDGDLRYTMRNTLLHPEFGVGYFGNWNGLKFVLQAGGGFGQMHYITHVFDYRTRDYQYDLHTQNYSAFLMPSIRLTEDASEFEVYASLRMRSMW